MSDAVTTTGILIKRADLATPAAFVTIGEITEIDPGGMSRNKIETSTHNDGSESHVLGILRQSDPTFKINYVGGNATHITLLSDMANNTKANWQIAFPSGKLRTGNARLQQFKFDPAPVDGKQGAMCAIVWAGPVVES
ncbi:MAG TPA: phage tail tube protein [Gemmatimonadaceae bacterium]|nr:phage tail tube protein [Gemmatimonadaceae bacterium]